MKDLNEADPRVRGLVDLATKFAVEVAEKVVEKVGKDSPVADFEVFSGALQASLASAAYGVAFREGGEKAADKWLEFFLSGLSEAIRGLGLRRCFAFARDPIVLDPRSSPSGPSSPRS